MTPYEQSCSLLRACAESMGMRLNCNNSLKGMTEIVLKNLGIWDDVPNSFRKVDIYKHAIPLWIQSGDCTSDGLLEALEKGMKILGKILAQKRARMVRRAQDGFLPCLKVPAKSCSASFGRRKDFYESPEWKSIRYAAFEKCGNFCCCCGKSPQSDPGTVLHVDHIKPRSVFPELALSIDNLQVLCAECNQAKSNLTFSGWIDSSGKSISPVVSTTFSRRESKARCAFNKARSEMAQQRRIHRGHQMPWNDYLIHFHESRPDASSEEWMRVSQSLTPAWKYYMDDPRYN